MKGFIVEKPSSVPISKETILLLDERDMTNVEFWEERLAYLKEPFTTAFREVEGRVLYSIFTNLKGKDSRFK